MTQPDQNHGAWNPDSPLDKLDDLGLTFADGLPPGPLTDEQKDAAKKLLDGAPNAFDEFSPEELEMFAEGQLIAAAGVPEPHTGAMIALVPSANDKQRMYLAEGEPVDQLHTTLMFLGEAAAISDEAKEAIIQWSRTAAETQAAIPANAFGIAMFNPQGDEPCWVLEVGESDPDAPVLQTFQSQAEGAVMGLDGLEVPPQHTPWRPHITMIYDGSTDWAFELVDATGPLTYDVLRVAFGGEVTDFLLRVPSLPDDETLYSAVTEHGGVTMSYHAALRAECPRSMPWAVVKDSDGSIQSVHGSRIEAESQIAVVSQHMAAGGSVTFVAGHPVFAEDVPTTSPSASGGNTALAAEDDGGPEADAAAPVGSWEAILALEGTPTGDGRQFATGALTWAELPIPLLWQKQVIGEGHMGQVTAGSIQEIWRDGAFIRARGNFDLNGTDGSEAYRQVREGFLKGLSIDPDSISDADVEYVYPEGDGGGDEMMDLFGPAPELTVFHAGRIRATTLVQIPAFVEAQLWLTDGQAVTPAAEPAEDEVDATHYSVYVDGTWDGPANQARLARVITPETARDAFANVSTQRNQFGQVPRGANHFLHHEIDAHGAPGAANITAVAGAIAAVNADTTLDHATRLASYNHLARHVRAAGLSPLPFVPSSTLVAASHTIVINDVPPAEWFNEPTDVPSHGALTVTDSGRVYGYLAPSKVAHRSFADRQVFVPMGNVDYSRFLGRETIVAGGGRVTTGCITMSCGHASTHPSVTGDDALQHYDNSCSIVASVNVGENNHGVWVAGSLLPGVDAGEVSRMMACQLSGDWRPITPRGGKTRELAGALLVPVPGFPMARTRPSVRVTDEGQLVASSVPVRFIHGVEHRDNPLHSVAQRVARSIGRDTASRVSELKSRIHGR